MVSSRNSRLPANYSNTTLGFFNFDSPMLEETLEPEPSDANSAQDVRVYEFTDAPPQLNQLFNGAIGYDARLDEYERAHLYSSNAMFSHEFTHGFLPVAFQHLLARLNRALDMTTIYTGTIPADTRYSSLNDNLKARLRNRIFTERNVLQQLRPGQQHDLEMIRTELINYLRAFSHSRVLAFLLTKTIQTIGEILGDSQQ